MDPLVNPEGLKSVLTGTDLQVRVSLDVNAAGAAAA